MRQLLSVFSIYRHFFLIPPPPSLLFCQTPLPFLKPLHVVLIGGGGGAVAVVLGGSTGASGFGPAEATEQTSAQEEQHAGPPAHVDARPQLPLLGGGHQGVVEVLHNNVGGPADGDDHQEARQQQAHRGHQAHLGLDVFVLYAGGEVGAAEEDEQAEAAEHAADDGQRAGGLQFRGQLQQGVVVLALLLAGALHHTGRPQALLTALLNTHTHKERGTRYGFQYILLNHHKQKRLKLFSTCAVTMLDPVKEVTFQRGTAQDMMTPIMPRTPRDTHTI